MSQQYRSLKYLSTFFFGCNYAGVIFGALTSPSDTNQERKSLFLWTVAKHAVFMSNNYLIHLLKLDLLHLRQLNLMNDFACFLTCAPAYFLLAYPRACIRFLDPYVSRAKPTQSLESPLSSDITQTTEVSGESQEKVETIEEKLQKQSIDEILENLNRQERERTKREENLFHTMHSSYKQQYKTPMEGAGWAVLACSITYFAVILRRRALGRR